MYVTNLFIVMYIPFSVFCVLFVCKCVLYYCHRVSTQLQLNIYHIISNAANILLQFSAHHICEQVLFSCLTNIESKGTTRLLSGEETLRLPIQKFGQEFSISAQNLQVSHWKQAFYWLWCLSKLCSYFFRYLQNVRISFLQINFLYNTSAVTQFRSPLTTFSGLQMFS
jgi:hypothetical protein